MPNLSQANRPVQFYIDGEEDDTLLPTSMQGFEELGRPHEYRVSFVSENLSLSYTSIIGKEASVGLEMTKNNYRYFSGYVTSFELVNRRSWVVEYRAVLRPWLWFLTRTSDCRIFQNQSVKDVILKVFADLGFSDYTDSLTGTYPTREYIVQYRETAFDFVSRLMEQEGIYYYFTHQKKGHKLILCDGISAHSDYPELSTFTYQPVSTGGDQKDHLDAWGVRHEVQTGKFTVNDFDFTAPSKQLREATVKSNSHPQGSLEKYEYPGLFTVATEGERYSKVRVEEEQVDHEVYTGKGTVRAMRTGDTFTLKGHATSSYNAEYLAIGAEYELHADNYDQKVSQQEDEEEKITFKGSIKAIAKATPFRPARRTPKPTINGPQTAIVVGPSGEEIYTDQYGRIKVQFHWDRDGTSDENSSCYIRVAQAWAGAKWGALFLPRIGHEVVVSFLEGDPDQPLVTGSVYNATNMPPYTLPDDKTKSTTKTNTTKGGNGYNEMRFNDDQGKEQLFVHATKDHDHAVVNDSKEWVGNNQHVTINNDRYEKIGEDHHETITRDHLVSVGRDMHEAVTGKKAVAVTGKLSVTVSDDVVEVFQKNHSQVVTNDLYFKGDNITIEATTNLTLHVGDCFIAINSSGIKISSTADIVIAATGDLTHTASTIKSTADTDVTVTGTGGKVSLSGATGVSAAASGGDFAASGLNTNLTAQIGAAIKGNATASVQASGEVTIKGAMVMIN